MQGEIIPTTEEKKLEPSWNMTFSRSGVFETNSGKIEYKNDNGETVRNEQIPSTVLAENINFIITEVQRYLEENYPDDNCAKLVSKFCRKCGNG